jgi:G3E family GTPase
MSTTSRTPITIITGSLGSGKTTLLRHILEISGRKLAILMNEFGEIAIDSKIIEGKNVQMAELQGGCVCCSLIGEFEAAVEEVIGTVQPEFIVVETTGLAEPEALVFDIQDSLPQVRLDGVVTVADADALNQFPSIGHTSRMQLEAADFILLNKIDLVGPMEVEAAEQRLRRYSEAPLIRTTRCRVDPDLLFGLGRERPAEPPAHKHQPEFQSFVIESDRVWDRACFEGAADRWDRSVYRAKGFIRFAEGTFLFNYVVGRWELEPFEQQSTVLVFIGPELLAEKRRIIETLRHCER